MWLAETRCCVPTSSDGPVATVVTNALVCLSQVSAPATIVKWDRKKHRHLLRFDFSDTCAWTDLSLEDFDIARTEARCIFLPQIAPDPNE